MDCNVSAEKSVDSLMRVPLKVPSIFSLVAFKILSLSLIFDSFIIMCLGEDLFKLILFTDL